ncbi:hypothetical protein OSB04_021820 [Centaurea solstitialis]|uniref:t-SNARE coiled-coil homology domain-containing protein n=1 Tax=Centaurea solstitialis TaxID=347529 RepID=A0AA38W5A6_9ASTR|nr:hypothetical protein OSB04_021820 [Centaurea solstitialis]
MRKTGKSMFSGGRSSRSSISSSATSSSSVKSSEFFDSNNVILPGRLSVDENTLRQRSSYYETRSDSFSDNNSESSDLSSPFPACRSSPAASYMAPTMSSRKFGIEVPSKFMNQSTPMHNNNSNSNNTSPTKYSTIKSNTISMKRTKSLGVFTPSRFGSRSPLISPSFSSSKPPSDPSARGKKNLLHMGLDLIKGKKGGSKSEKYTNESVHQLRLLQNSWMQWRYVNARAQVVHENLAAESENNLLCTRESMMQLRQSVVHKRLQLQKGETRHETPLDLIFSSDSGNTKNVNQDFIKILEAWEGIERRHTVDLSIMKDYLHNVVCMIPLIEGAKVDLESTSIAFQHSSHIVSTIKSMLSSISPTAHETILPLSKLAEVVAQEKLLLEECYEHLKVISELEQYQELKRQAYVDDMEVGGGVRKETVDLDKFFLDVENVKKDMMVVEELYKKLQESNEESKMVQDANKMKKLRSKMDLDFTQVLKHAKVIKGKLEALDKSNAENRKIPGCGPGSSADRTRILVVTGLGKKLKIMMDEFQELRALIYDEYKETVGRRYFTITGEKANEEVIENLISSGKGEDFLQKAIQDQGRGQIMDTVSEIQERHNAIIEIETNLIELHQIFLDMAVLVEAQGQQLNNIESHVAHASSFVRIGTEHLTEAKELQKSSRTCTCIAISIILITIFIVILLIMLPVSSQF